MTQHLRRSCLYPFPFLLVALLLFACGVPVGAPPQGSGPPAAQNQAATENYLFCFWNLENCFDDKLDHRPNTPDKEYDAWFSSNPAVWQQKMENLSSVLVSLNDGKGPDILAMAELESVRAAELLQEALNKKLAKPELQYKNLLMEEIHSGRNIATGILTRLPVDARRTRLLDKRRRILEGHIVVNDQDLVVMASHWTSRLTDHTGDGRDKYADEIYGRYKGMFLSNRDVAFLVCGDFNDTPEDDSVKDNLHGRPVEQIDEVRKSTPEPLLLDLFGGPAKEKDPRKWGTHNHRGHWYTFDQILVSPGMLDHKGWTCEVDTVEVINTKTADKKGRPVDFGSENDDIPLKERGWSDHFPVTVRLKVEGK
jgi:endonuclease/exonuclease/phosphatase family metal-dependent hydrolase